MLGKSTFYNATLRKYTAAFGSIFDDIVIDRPETSNSVATTIKVPLHYAAKAKFIQKMLHQEREDDKNNVKQQMVLPVMSFMLNTIEYSQGRQLPKQIRKVSNSSDGQIIQYMFVPYDISFTLSIFTETMNDMLSIIEQIIPAFTPDYTLRMKDNPIDDTLISDVPLILGLVDLQQYYEGDFTDRRLLTADLQFVLQGKFYGGQGTGTVIKDVIINFDLADTEEKLLQYEAKINPIDANEDDDYVIDEFI